LIYLTHLPGCHTVLLVYKAISTRSWKKEKKKN